jgi:O-antigen ligase
MISITLGLLLTWGTRVQKFFLLVLLFFSTVALAATLSRSSWIALGPMALSLLYFSDKKKTVLFCIIALIIAAPFIVPKSVKERMLFTVTQAKEEGQMRIGNTRNDTSTSARLESMKQVLTRDFAKSPVIGFGDYGYSFSTPSMPDSGETGILGLLAFIYLLSSIFRQAKQTYRKTNDTFFQRPHPRLHYGVLRPAHPRHRFQHLYYR